MKAFRAACMVVIVFLITSLRAMNDQEVEEELTETRIALQGNSAQIPSTPSRSTMNHTIPSSKEWVWESPYASKKCNEDRCFASVLSLGYSAACSAIKGFTALCIIRQSNDSCNDVCQNIWFPTGYDNCHSANSTCLSVVHWTTTLGIVIPNFAFVCFWNPFCNKKGPHCCCRRVDVEKK